MCISQLVKKLSALTFVSLANHSSKKSCIFAIGSLPKYERTTTYQVWNTSECFPVVVRYFSDKEAPKICVFLEKSCKNISVFLENSGRKISVFFHKTPKKNCVRWNYAEAMLHFQDSSEFLLILRFDSSEFLYICS